LLICQAFTAARAAIGRIRLVMNGMLAFDS
jgi:hypothetical protein